ncbi:hypothetical protein AA98_0299 [Escherichia coli 2-011-08_S1_C1]|nr:hypothetical protein AA98_0299 [Escherichia coli 2-011-08_S1_C1]
MGTDNGRILFLTIKIVREIDISSYIPVSVFYRNRFHFKLQGFA